MTEAHDAGPSPAFVYTCIALWIANSTVCMLLNKYVLHYLKFAFPSVLAVMHMFAAAVLTTFLVHANYDSGVPTISALGPRLAAQLAGIACMFGLVLLLSNTAFEYLSVPTIQMLKSSGPVTTFCVGMILGTERYSHVSLAKVAIVGVGVVIASYGDSDANVRGIVVQVGAIICDAVRCTLLQMVMQNSRVKLSPVGTLFYIAPIATLGLCLPAGLVELPQLYFHDPPIPWVWLMASCAAATSLNLIGFTLIGKTSALTTSVTGPLKSWICIVAAMFTFNTPVSLQQWCGYCVAFCGIMWYQYDKFWSKRPVKSDLAKLLEKATPEHVQTAKDQNGH